MSENNRQLGQTPIFGQLFTYLKKFLLHWNSKSECYNSQIIYTKNFIKIFLQGKKLSRLQNPNFVIFCKIMSRLRKSPHMWIVGKTSIKGPRFTLLKFGILIPKNIQKYWVLNILEYWFQIPIEEPNCPIYQTPCIPERNITHVWCKSYSMSIQILISHSILVVL